VWYNKGLTLEKLENFQGAINCFRTVLELNPHDAGAWYTKACDEDKLKQKTQALNALTTSF